MQNMPAKKQIIIHSMADFGQALRDARKKQHLTQVELARFSRCNPRFISELERGKPTAEMGKALYVANMLSLDIAIVARS
jgi:transcriptional regulator with XRE-family HTH domain